MTAAEICDFIIKLVVILIGGFWGFMIICGYYGLLNDDKPKKNNKNNKNNSNTNSYKKKNTIKKDNVERSSEK